MTTAAGHPEHPEQDDKHRLTAVQGLAALSLDALSSVAYGPEAILVVLVAAGTAGLHYSLPITGAIIILLAALVISYRQVIEAFPGGGGAYAVAKAHLGTRASLVAAASLIVDYVLNPRIHLTYDKIGALLGLGQTPRPPARKKSLVVVPVASISRLTAAGISTALSIGDDVTAVKVVFTDPEDEEADEAFRRRWEEWHPNVPLVTLHTAHRSIAQPIVKYLSRIEAEERYHQLVVLIPEVQPPRFWDYLLFNQRGVILERAIRRGTANVVLCRLHYRLEHFTSRDAPAPDQPAGSTPPR